MKRFLVLLFAVSLSLSGFATNTWDKPLGKAAFDDPYVDVYNAAVSGDRCYPSYKLTVFADFNKTVGVPYYVVIQVYGVWNGIGIGYKQFTLLYGSTQWHKSVDYTMSCNEEAYTETTELVDYGPQ